jgi:hypothetical protein
MHLSSMAILAAGRTTMGRDAVRHARRERKNPTRDLEKILHLLRQATDALVAAEDRIRLLQTRNEQLQEIASGELDAVHASLASAEGWAMRAEVRAVQAECVAHALREWVDQVSNGLDEVLTRSDVLTELITAHGDFKSNAA